MNPRLLNSCRRTVALKGLMLALLAGTAASTMSYLGFLDIISSVVVVAIKCIVIASFYFGLRRASIMARIATLTAVLCVGVLMALTGIDYASRHPQPPSWQHSAPPTFAQPVLGSTA